MSYRISEFEVAIIKRQSWGGVQLEKPDVATRGNRRSSQGVDL